MRIIDKAKQAAIVAAVNTALTYLEKDPQTNIPKLMDLIDKVVPEGWYEGQRNAIREAVKNPAIDPKAIAPLLQQRCEVLTEIPEKVDFFEAVPEYDVSLYANKKNKLKPEDSLELLKVVRPRLEAVSDWTSENILETLNAIAAEREAKIGKIMWPVRVSLSGKAVTPGGPVEICTILGKEESLRRMDAGLAKLEGAIQ